MTPRTITRLVEARQQADAARVLRFVQCLSLALLLAYNALLWVPNGQF